MSHGVQGRSQPSVIDSALARTVAERMQALAAPSRVSILGRLRQGPCSVGELVAAVEMGQSAVSHQLRLLRQLRLVVSERRGRQIFYGLHDSHVAELLDQAVFHVEHLQIAAPEPLVLPVDEVS